MCIIMNHRCFSLHPCQSFHTISLKNAKCSAFCEAWERTSRFLSRLESLIPELKHGIKRERNRQPDLFS